MALKKLTAEGRFECGLDAIVAGKVWAFVAITPTKGTHGMATLGVAIANEPGYMPVPMNWAWADKWEEIDQHADELNRAMGLTDDHAMHIVASTMRKVVRS